VAISFRQDRQGRRYPAFLRYAVPAVLAIALAACSGSTNSGSSGSSSPHRGGTLTLVGDGDVDHLDTASIYSGVTYTIERAFTRQLVTYPATGRTSMPSNLVPDMATQVPSTANGGITDGGRTYTYKIKPGVQWDTSPARQVTAADVVRGIKLLCNPVSPTGAPGYYESTIVGFASFCSKFLKVSPTAAAIKSYVDSNNLPGVVATGPLTVQFHLIQAASDFNDIMSLPFSSPAPVEYLNYVPDSAAFRQHTISDGPYKISTYVPNQKIVLTRNPAWKASTDDVRKAYVNQVDVTEGQDATTVQQELSAGTADMEWDEQVPSVSLPSLVATHNPGLLVYQAGSLDPYVVINFQSPNEGKATSKLGVRQALEYAVDKTAIEQVNGGTILNEPLNQVITPGNVGYQQFDLYPSAGNSGNPAKAKSLLAAAGYPNGIKLKLIYDNVDPDPQIAQTLQSDLAKAGITLELQQVPQDNLYGQYLAQPSDAKRGVWDLAVVDWGPDWFGNNGRTTVQPLLEGSTYGPGSSDYGDYNSTAENNFINEALAASTPAATANYWHLADEQAMKDAALIPIDVHKHAIFASTAVHNLFIDPYSRVGDVTNVWLSSSG
jgi:peptide/nickel transport system substrate-binding protein